MSKRSLLVLPEECVCFLQFLGETSRFPGDGVEFCRRVFFWCKLSAVQRQREVRPTSSVSDSAPERSYLYLCLLLYESLSLCVFVVWID